MFHGLLFAMALSVPFAPAIVPIPRQAAVHGGHFVLADSARVTFEDPSLAAHAEVLAGELEALTGVDVQARMGKPADGDVVLALDAALKGEQYRLDVGKRVVARGADAHAVSLATSTLLQVLEGTKVPRMAVADEPTTPYRGFLIDVARQFHELDTLEQAIQLARLYKVRYVQLHLTDDQSFTFESKKYPALATPERHYTQEQLRALVAFAEARGVTLVPELDLPGHSTEMRRRMPELFGPAGLSVIDVANPAAMDAVKDLIREMIDVFAPSPYFHIGADEVWLVKLEERPSAQEAVKARGFDNVHDLYLASIVEMHEAVKAAGRKTLMWESFSGTGSRTVKIPKDVLVMAWESAYQRPESLLANGYDIINASWKPTYVTPGIQWTPEEIYNWNMYRWQNWVPGMPSYDAIDIEPTKRVLGTQFNAWEMADAMTVPAARIRVPVVSEKAWNPTSVVSYEEFQRRLDATDLVFQRLVLPVFVRAKGLVAPGYVGGIRNRENAFGDTLELTLEPARAGLQVWFTLDGTAPEFGRKTTIAPILRVASTRLRTQAFDSRGVRVGHIQTIDYEFEPLQGEVSGLIETTRWEHPSKPRTQFAGSVSIAMRTLRPGRMRVTLDGSAPNLGSDPLFRTLEVDQSATVRVQLFNDAGAAVGKEWRREFVKVPYEASLSTGKPVATSNNETGSDPKVAVDGLIDVNQHWGGSPAPQWLQVDLGAAMIVGRVHLTPYWDGNRSYKYRIETSVDGKRWQLGADASRNTAVATAEGVQHPFASRMARFVRVTMLGNTANQAVHIVELAVYEHLAPSPTPPHYGHPERSRGTWMARHGVPSPHGLAVGDELPPRARLRAQPHQYLGFARDDGAGARGFRRTDTGEVRYSSRFSRANCWRVAGLRITMLGFAARAKSSKGTSATSPLLVISSNIERSACVGVGSSAQPSTQSPGLPSPLM